MSILNLICSNPNMLVYFYLVVCVLIVEQGQSSFASTPTYSQLGLEGGSGTTVQISGDQSMICAGFTDGTFKIFDMEVNQLCSSISTPNSSIIGSAWMPSYGPVTIDTANVLTLWDTNCSITTQTTLNASAIGIGYYQLSNSNTNITSGLITLNFGSYIQQYDVNTFGMKTQYNPNGNQTFLCFVYFNDGNNNSFLTASNSQSQVRVMNMMDGTETNSYDAPSPIKMMIVVTGNGGSEINGYGEDKNIYRITTFETPYQIGSFQTSGSMAECPSTSEFALAWTDTQGIGDYLYTGVKQKQLTGLHGTPKQVVCSNTYLVSIDTGGYINVYTQEEFKNWIIGVIVGIVGGLLLLIIGIIVFIRLRRKWAREADEEKYRTNKPKKYPRIVNQKASKLESVNMLQNMTLQTTMRQ